MSFEFLISYWSSDVCSSAFRGHLLRFLVGLCDRCTGQVAVLVAVLVGARRDLTRCDRCNEDRREATIVRGLRGHDIQFLIRFHPHHEDRIFLQSHWRGGLGSEQWRMERENPPKR